MRQHTVLCFQNQLHKNGSREPIMTEWVRGFFA